MYFSELSKSKLYDVLKDSNYSISRDELNMLEFSNGHCYFSLVYNHLEHLPYLFIGSKKYNVIVIEIDNYTLINFFHSNIRIEGIETFVDNVILFFRETRGALLINADEETWHSLNNFNLERSHAYTNEIINKQNLRK